MAGFNGRELTFDWDSSTLVGVRTRTVSASNELVDVTTDDDNGWRTLLNDPGVKSIEVTIGFVVSDETMLAEFFAAQASQGTLRANLPSSLTTPGNFSGTFGLSALEYSADHDGAVEATATFMSSGAVTYSASA